MAKGRSGFKLGGWPDTGRLISTLMPLTTPSIRAEGGDPMTAFERLVDATGARRVGSGWMALCPAHEDRNPSLSVSEGDMCALVTCHAGCETEAVLSALGISMRDLYDEPLERTDPDEWVPKGHEFVDSYDYVDASGRLVFQVVRARDEKGEKTFWQRRPDVGSRSGWAWNLRELSEEQRLIPYRLREVTQARDAGQVIWIAEGEKDAEALVRAGVCATCNAGGAGKWTARHASHLSGAASVTVVQDKDRAGRAHGAAVVRSLSGVAQSVRLVEAATGKDAADHLRAGHSLDDFVAVEAVEAKEDEAEKDAEGEAKEDEETAEPSGTPRPSSPGASPRPAEGDPYADSPISERVVADAMRGHWLWTTGLGWMAWSGQVWKQQPDVSAAEVVRQWVDGEVAQVALQGDRHETERAAGMQAENRISRVLRLCRGQVLADTAAFDADPELLVAANGVIDLRTGTLLPHDPSRLVTKATPVAYHPEARHEDWAKALGAVPEEVVVWLRLRLGQAATGHTPDDDRMLLLQGSGENGKTTLLSAVMTALGAYAGLVPDRLLLASPDAHPTEMMSLRGVRLAVIEETPEGRRLSVARLKKTVGTPLITARLVYRDSTTFTATHALFLSSNYRPVIEETDHGTWRRLGLISFPYKFVKPGTEIAASTDRTGDPRLRSRLHGEAQQQAILAWLVSGARSWYEAGQIMPPLPARVEQDGLVWRSESDSVLAYATERLEAASGSCVLAKDLLADLNHWLCERGQQEWSDRTLASRLGGHDWTAEHGIEKRKVRHNAPALSRSYHRCAPGPISASYQAWTGVKFRNPDADAGTVPGVPDRSELSPIAYMQKVPTLLEQPEHTTTDKATTHA